MNPRERLRCVFSHQTPDRLPMVEWATWWDKTLIRWYGEGAPVCSGLELRNWFGQDAWQQMWISSSTDDLPEPAAHGAPLITNMAEYKEIKRFLYPDVDLTSFRAAKPAHEAGELGVWFTFEGFFWFPRGLLGIEPHLTSFYDEPELYHTICADLLAWQQRTLDAILSVLTPDFMTFGEDMSYNLGPMIGKHIFDEFLAPYYRVIVPMLKSAGISVILDSDGDITSCLGWYLDVGMDGILPLERQAGVDVMRLQDEHPGVILIGAFDKMVMPHGEAAMRAEFERLLPAMRRGGFIPSVDHQTPPGVSLSQYQTYMALLNEYVRKAVEPT